jgi:hypothetical protein
MIPSHSDVVKTPTTVCAGHALLQLVVPFNDPQPALALPRHHAYSRAAEVDRVVSLPTALAPGLVASASAVEVIKALFDAAPTTSLHVVIMDNT